MHRVRLPIARPAICDLRLIAGRMLLFVLLSRNMRSAIGRMSQVVVRFDVARLTARPVAGSLLNLHLLRLVPAFTGVTVGIVFWFPFCFTFPATVFFIILWGFLSGIGGNLCIVWLALTLTLASLPSSTVKTDGLCFSISNVSLHVVVGFPGFLDLWDVLFFVVGKLVLWMSSRRWSIEALRRMELLLCVKFRSLCDGRLCVMEEISTLSRCSGDEDFMPRR
ncbi:hypothetical protein F2Q68_00026961 [Brassica cretica]|uniref:Uncharacterized protein n=1 Tax=Brassica cretica TaxID=69181 RepID=A0A8S9I9T7_BRACR|nr:hypothetical protein F2Q68_00026961 [Brassica cretica]